MSTPYMPRPVKVEKLGQHMRFLFRCDDRDGYLLSVLWAGDGDFHLAIEADPDHEEFPTKVMRVSGSVRLRMPLIGGGSFEFLHPALVDAIRSEWAKYKADGGRED